MSGGVGCGSKTGGVGVGVVEAVLRDDVGVGGFLNLSYVAQCAIVAPSILLLNLSLI